MKIILVQFFVFVYSYYLYNGFLFFFFPPSNRASRAYAAYNKIIKNKKKRRKMKRKIKKNYVEFLWRRAAISRVGVIFY